MYDIIVIGGGPAGMTAAIYARRSGKSVLLIERSAFGGQMAISPKVENYPGFISASGAELADKMLEQAIALGAELALCEVSAIRQGPVKTVCTDDGDFEAKALIIAAGVQHRHLGLPGEDELTGCGVSFCAVCDGAFYAGKTVAVIGGGNSALQEALLLSQSCESVIICHRREFTADQALQDALAEQPNIAAMNFVRPLALRRDDNGSLTGLTLCWTEGDGSFDLSCDGVFVAVGLQPENNAFSLTGLDSAGYILAGEDCHTAAEGIFAAGDCRSKGVRQIATAVADGAVAATEACRYLSAL